MPIYEYRCDNGHTFEVFQSMSDDPVQTCEECGAPVQRVLHSPAIHFKGSGFHNTDYKKSGQGAKPSGEGGGDSDKSEKKPESSSSDSSKSDSTSKTASD